MCKYVVRWRVARVRVRERVVCWRVVCYWEGGGGSGRRTGAHNQKQEPHTKMRGTMVDTAKNRFKEQETRFTQ